ncbi:MAG: hypothetical protein IJ121_01555 [Eubacterium sp.]|nr:hypothetical protein [Eubacterium sp.]
MRLYKQELKRIFKTTRTRIVFTIAIVMSALLALLAAQFSGANVPDENGNITQLDGVAAIRYIEEAYKPGNGEASIKSLKNALETYQRLYTEYGVDPLKDGFPLDVRWEQISPIRTHLRMITQAYSTSTSSVNLMALSPDDLDSFYDDCRRRLTETMSSDDLLKDSATIEKALSIYDEVDTPFTISHGYTRDAFDYIEFTILLLTLLSAVLVAPVFSERYKSGEDSVLRCTEFGRGVLVRTTLLVTVTVVSIMYLAGMVTHLIISDIMFGMDSLKESVQVLYSVYSLPALDLFGLQMVLFLSGWLICLAVAVASACISAIASDPSTSIVISIVLVFLPTILYAGLGNTSWVLPLLPSAGVGLSNNMLMSLVDLRFLSAGSHVFWYPAVLVIFAIIETAIFWCITHLAYNRYQVR